MCLTKGYLTNRRLLLSVDSVRYNTKLRAMTNNKINGKCGNLMRHMEDSLLL